MIGRAAVLLAAALPLATCDDMTRQPKAGAWSAASHNVRAANNVWEWQDRPEMPPPLTLALLQRGNSGFGSTARRATQNLATATAWSCSVAFRIHHPITSTACVRHRHSISST